jgi:hypothetical protein
LFAKPWRKRKPITPRRLWVFVGFTLAWEVSIAILAFGLMPNR